MDTTASSVDTGRRGYSSERHTPARTQGVQHCRVGRARAAVGL
ncbi:hypothetical protein A8926_3783 [Saccharopolyspora spinosa]|uniref:Uncharacterized protein n=1 Tax=Saccharopolyspora spinosa TaxID=60894 RepID=A0A2N3XZC9_SACSN|nr:hypothetical protein A8926_3783 [Saccharopolyspora spinosa]